MRVSPEAEQPLGLRGQLQVLVGVEDRRGGERSQFAPVVCDQLDRGTGLRVEKNALTAYAKRLG
jgi:hypothetical protein